MARSRWRYRREVRRLYLSAVKEVPYGRQHRTPGHSLHHNRTDYVQVHGVDVNNGKQKPAGKDSGAGITGGNGATFKGVERKGGGGMTSSEVLLKQLKLLRDMCNDLRIIVGTANEELKRVKAERDKLYLQLTALQPNKTDSGWHVGRQSPRNIWYGNEHVACAFQEWDAAIIVNALMMANRAGNTVNENLTSPQPTKSHAEPIPVEDEPTSGDWPAGRQSPGSIDYNFRVPPVKSIGVVFSPIPVLITAEMVGSVVNEHLTSPHPKKSYAEPTPAEEVTELRGEVKDWHTLYGQLEAQLLAMGFLVVYGEEGQAVITPAVGEWDKRIKSI